MKNIKIGEDANIKLVHYTEKIGMSKRAFLDILLNEITPYELQQIFGRVWFKFDEPDGYQKEKSGYTEVETEYDYDDEDELILTDDEEDYEEIKKEIKGL